MKLTKSRMKLSDYLRLGKLSIAARKKSTKNTIFGMSFGLILLIPMIFFAIAFYTDVSKKVNEVRLASTVNIPLKNINDSSASIPYREYSSRNEYQEGLSAFANYDELTEIDGLDEYMLSERRFLNFLNSGKDADFNLIIYDNALDEESTTDISGDSQEGYIDDNARGIYELKIIYPNYSNVELFTSGEIADYKALTNRSNPLVASCNEGFTEETLGKGEIIISEIMLRQWNIDKEDIENNYISISYPEFHLGGRLATYYNIDDDNNPNNNYTYAETGEELQTYLFYQYKVVGVISEEYYELPGKGNESHIWVTAPSVYYKEGKEDYVPISFSINESDNGNVITFEDDKDELLEKNIDEQYMLFIQSYADAYKENYQNNRLTFTLCQTNLFMQFESFETLTEQLSEIKFLLSDTYSELSLNRLMEQITNEIFIQFRMIDQVGLIIIIVFTAIGGIILFTNILNLLNIIRYSVESRKNYIGVMRAIGAKSRVIPRMYVFEILIIFFRTFIITAIFSTGVSFGLKYGLDYVFSLLGDVFSFKMNFIYFPIAFGAAFFSTCFIGLLFATIAARLTAYQPILKTLYDEK